MFMSTTKGEQLMKADINIDFDALLAAVQEQWNIREKALLPISEAKYSHGLCGGNVGTDVYRQLDEEESDIKLKYQIWIRENLTDRGIMMKTNGFDRKPVALWIVVASVED
jgi:hypothetical protein